MIDTNPYFILSQAGLAMACVSGILVMDITSRTPTGRTWYYYVAVWLVSLGCAFEFGDSAANGMSAEMAEEVWRLRLAIGIERFAVFVSYRFAIGGSLPQYAIARINRYVGLSSGLLVIGLLAYNAYYVPRPDLKDDLQDLRVEVLKNRAAVVADTTYQKQMQRRIDTLTAELSESRQVVASLTGQLSKANQQLSELVDVVVSMRKAIARLGVSVERQRTAVTVPIAPLKPLPPTGLIPTGKVQTPAPVKGPIYRNGRRISANGMGEGNQYSDAGKPEK